MESAAKRWADQLLSSSLTGTANDPQGIILNALSRSKEVTGNIIEVLGIDKYKLRPLNKVFDNFADALMESRMSSFRQFDEIVDGKLTTSARQLGASHYGFLEEVSKRMTTKFGHGAAVQRISVGTDKAGMNFSANQMKRGGIIIPDDDSSTLLRFLNAEGKDLSAKQISAFLQSEFGMKIEDTGKVFKRMKQMTNARDMDLWQKDAFKVGLFDPDVAGSGLAKKLPGGVSDDTMAVLSTEGMSVMNPQTARKMRDSMADRLGELKSLPNASDHAGAIRSLERSLGDLDRAVKHGGRFNMRMLGIEAEALGGEFGGILPENIKKIVKGQIKGDVQIGVEEEFLKGGRFFGRDIITSVHNIKKEMQMTKGAFFTLEGHPYGDDVFADVQSLAHLKGWGAGDIDDMIDYTQQQFDDALDAITEGEVPEGLLRHLEEASFAGDDFASTFLERRNLGVPLTQDPSDMGLLTEMVTAYYESSPDKPRLLMPDAKRAKITTSVFGDVMGTKVGIDAPKRGSISFDKASGWILGEQDFAEAYQALGGADLDDTMVALLRFDDATESLKVLGYRQPNAMGEHVTFNIDAADEFSLDVLHRAGQTDAVEIREMEAGIKQAERERRESISRIRDEHKVMRAAASSKDEIAEINRLQQEAIDGAEDSYRFTTEMFEDGIKDSKDAIRRNIKGIADSGAIRKLDFTELEKASFQAVDSKMRGAKGLHPAFELMKPVKDETGGKGKAGLLTVDTMLDRMNTLVETQGQLGRYSNARMIADSLVSEFSDDFSGQAGVFKVAPQESVIDTLIAGFRMVWQGDDFNVAKVTDEMYSEIGYQAARLFHESGGTKGLDRGILTKKAARDSEAMKYLREGFSRYSAYAKKEGIEGVTDFSKSFDVAGGIGPFAEYSKSYWSRLFAEKQMMLEGFRDRRKDVMAGVQYPESIMGRGLASKKVRGDADRLLKVYEASMKTSKIKARSMVETAALGMSDELIDAEIDRTAKRLTHANVLGVVGEWVEESGTGKVDDYVLERIAEAMRSSVSPGGRHGARGLFSMVSSDGISMSRLKNAAFHWSEQNADWLADSQRVVTNTDDEIMDLLNDAAKAKRFGGVDLGDIDQESIADAVRSLGGLDDDVFAEVGDLGADRAAASATGDTAAGTVVNNFKRMNMADIKGLWDNASFRKGSLAALATVGFSFGYQMTKDRSPEDMQGPPMLPGGEFYSGSPTGAFGQIPSLPGPGEGGITYKINASGVADPDRFRRDLNTIANFPTSGTMYSAPSFNNIFSDIDGTF